MRVRPHARAAALLAGALLASAAGCLVVTPLDDVPSESAGGAQAGTKAGSTHGGGTAPGGAGGTPDSSEGGSAGEPVSDGHCKSNAECTKLNADEPASCRASDHTCVALKSDECPVVLGPYKDPNALYLGAFATLDRVTPGDNAIIWAHQLAINELDGDNVGGLPDGPDGARRPLVMIVCNNLPDTVDPAMKHLADTVQAPAVVATLKPGDLRRAFETYKKRDIFYLSPVSVTTPLVAEADDGHIWNLLGQPSDLAPAYVELLKLSEAHVRGLYDIPAPDSVKVALVTTLDAFDDELANALRGVLQFNGKSVSGNGANFKDFTIPDDPDFTQLAKQIGAFQPDIVISAASEPFVVNGGLQDVLEADWEGISSGKRRPFYILSPFNAGDLSDMLGRISGQLERAPAVQDQQRYVGVSIASAVDNTLQNAYEIRLSSVMKNPINDTANYYDAVYFLAYAMYGANQPDGVTGSGIKDGMLRLLAGDDVNVGPVPISSTFKTLSDRKKSVHLVSTLGPPDFNPITGVRPVNGSVFCIGRTGNTAKPSFDGLRYDQSKKALVGDELPCISGFFPP